MDTSDPDIKFDEYGHCNHCTSAISALKNLTFSGDEAQKRLFEHIDKIRKEGKNNKYDCLIGLSGGVDSSYLAYKCKEWNLRPLLFHVDGGWNTPQSAHNVQAIADYLGYPLERYVVNWDEMRDLHRSFLAAGVPNQDIPQDHLFFATLFKIAKKRGVRYWLSGSNYISESILPKAWGGYAMDAYHLKAIHNQFGTIRLRTYPILSFFEYCKYYTTLGKNCIYRIDLLNFLPYDPYKARIELQQACGWKDYGGKHGESIFTRFFQNYFLPQRFGFDKRKAHLSSLIIANQLSREEALNILQQTSYPSKLFEEDKKIILRKLGYTESEFENIMNAPLHKHSDYKNSQGFIKFAWKLKTLQNAIDLIKEGKFKIFFEKLLSKLKK